MPKIGNQKYSKSLYLGRQFENNARAIRFDISEWVNEFGAGTVELLHMRHGDAVPYSVPFSRVGADGNKNDLIGIYVLWNVSSIDTAQAFSDGQAELRYYAENADDYLLKSEIYRTVVSEALGTPLPEEDWYKSLISKLSSIDDIVGEVTVIRDEILSGVVITENNYTTAEKNKLAGIEDGAEANVIVSVSVNDNPVEILNKNISLRIPTKVSELTNDSGYLTEHQDISGKLDINKVGVSGGVAELDENGIIISAQLPAFVDDVLEYESISEFPSEGESGKIYVVTDTNLSYRWSGSAYVEISPSIALGETSSTAYRGDRGKTAYNHSQTTGNAHNMTKADIGLGNVPNVTTNDQTPTYMPASALAALVSGETLSVAFEKLAKGISDLISHIADSVKHITEAERTAWNNKVDKETGKGLSTNDYTTAEKNKLSGIEAQANKTSIDPTLSNAGQAADAKTTGDILSALQSLISRAEIYCEASGNPATFSDAKAANVKVLSVGITPTQSGSGDPSPSNVRPISGVSSVTVTRTGKNLWGGAKMLADFTALNQVPFDNRSGGVTYLNASFNGSKVTYNAGWASHGAVFAQGIFRENTRYTFVLDYQTSGETYINARVVYTDGTIYRIPRTNNASQGTAVYVSDAGKTVLSLSGDFHNGSTTLDSALCGIFEGVVTAAEFEAYQGQTVTAALIDSNSNPLTVYGGTLDVTTGELVVTHQSFIVSGGLSRYANYDTATHYGYITNALDSIKANSTTQCMADSAFMGTSSTAALCVRITGGSSRGEFLLRKDLLADNTAANANAYLTANPIQVVAPLAAPLTYQLTPQQLATLHGYNTVSSDAGTVSVTYRANVSFA